MEGFERGLAKLGISQRASEEGSTADIRSRAAERKGGNTDEAERMQWRSQPAEQLFRATVAVLKRLPRKTMTQRLSVTEASENRDPQTSPLHLILAPSMPAILPPHKPCACHTTPS